MKWNNGNEKNNLATLTGNRILGNTGSIRIDRDGVRIAGVLFALCAAETVWYVFSGNSVLAAAALFFGIGTAYTLYFFRDPQREGPADLSAAVSAADGVVVDVSEAKADGLDDGTIRIAVFMNVFNVHVNRTPLAGDVIRTDHQPGKKMSAYNPRAATDNEYGEIDIAAPAGLVRIRQIAGLVARRVVTRVSAGDTLARGDRIGLIRFGSRVDVFLPATYIPSVSVGDKVRAGETVIARYHSGEPEQS